MGKNSKQYHPVFRLLRKKTTLPRRIVSFTYEPVRYVALNDRFHLAIGEYSRNYVNGQWQVSGGDVIILYRIFEGNSEPFVEKIFIRPNSRFEDYRAELYQELVNLRKVKRFKKLFLILPKWARIYQSDQKVVIGEEETFQTIIGDYGMHELQDPMGMFDDPWRAEFIPLSNNCAAILWDEYVSECEPYERWAPVILDHMKIVNHIHITSDVNLEEVYKALKVALAQ